MPFMHSLCDCGTDSALLMVALPLPCTAATPTHSPTVQAVTPVPDTTSAPVDILGGAAAGTPAVEELGVADFLVIACDGLWDCVTNQQVRGSTLACKQCSVVLHASGGAVGKQGHFRTRDHGESRLCPGWNYSQAREV